MTLLDAEYLRATTAAELTWVSGVIAELRSDALTWTYDDLADAARAFLAD